MLSKNNFIKYIGVFSCFLGLIAIRMFENTLFYDPLIAYFKGNFQHETIPDYHTAKLFLHLSYRFALNSFLSLLIIFLVFQDKNITKLALFLFTILLPILLIIIYIMLKNYSPANYNALFYSRRFLIQPIFGMLFLAAFYYQKKFSK